MSLLYLLGGIGLVILLGAMWQTGKLRKILKRKTIKAHFPQALSMLLVVSQASELVRLVEHVSVVTVVAALLLLAILLATKSGTEGELY